MNIENKKQLATILLAVGLGLVASMLMSKVVSDKVEQQTKIIAKEYQGKSAALVKEVDATKKALNKLMKNHEALAKKVALQPDAFKLATSQLGTPKRPPVQKMAFSLRTPPGKRALTIEINSLAAVGGLVNAGDYVDIIAHLEVPTESSLKKKSSEKVTMVLFQNIQVLAVGTNFDPIGEVPEYSAQQQAKTLNVTLAVSPEEAGLLTFAEINGELQLSLRSPAETEDQILQEVASWGALADFVLEHQGTELRVPKSKATILPGETEEIEEEKADPFIQIFRGGREL